MSDFMASTHQNRFRAYSAPPEPLAGFKGPTSKEGEIGRDGKGRGRGRQREGKRGGEGKRGE